MATEKKQPLSRQQLNRLRNGIVGMGLACVAKAITKNKTINEIADYSLTIIANDLAKIPGVQQTDLNKMQTELQYDINKRIDNQVREASKAKDEVAHKG